MIEHKEEIDFVLETEEHETASEETLLSKLNNRPKKEAFIRDQKLKGAEHVNHVGNYVEARRIGPDCYCKRLKCFTRVTAVNRDKIFRNFYAMRSKDLQDSYLAGLICIEEIKQRRPRVLQGKKNRQEDHIVDSDEPSSDSSAEPVERKGSHAASVFYKVRFQNEKGLLVDVPVCRAAFTSIHGITPARIRRIYNCLIKTGLIPVDNRGKYKNRPKIFPNEVKDLIKHHILSFGPKQLAKDKSQRQILPETLSIRKMYKQFLNEYQIQISYRDYWNVFKTRFNIKFGTTRKAKRDKPPRNNTIFDANVSLNNDIITKVEPLPMQNEPFS